MLAADLCDKNVQALCSKLAAIAPEDRQIDDHCKGAQPESLVHNFDTLGRRTVSRIMQFVKVDISRDECYTSWHNCKFSFCCCHNENVGVVSLPAKVQQGILW